MIEVHAGIGFLGNDLALTNAGNRDRKIQAGCFDTGILQGRLAWAGMPSSRHIASKIEIRFIYSNSSFRTVARGNLVPAELFGL